MGKLTLSTVCASVPDPHAQHAHKGLNKKLGVLNEDVVYSDLRSKLRDQNTLQAKYSEKTRNKY